MPDVAGSSLGVLQAALRTYLAEHPEAADGLVGIRLWWLPEPLRDVAMPSLHHALNQLVEQGEMRRTEMLDGTQLYASSRSEHRRTRPDDARASPSSPLPPLNKP